jgi:DNA-binding transcriptional ArsR family regulator
MTYLNQGLQALGDPTRLAILRALAEGPLPVARLAEGFPISRPAISQHLQVLKRAGLVTNQQRGTQRLYRIDPAGIEALKAHFDTLWTSVLAEFKAVAERHPESTPVPEKKHARRNAKRNARSGR